MSDGCGGGYRVGHRLLHQRKKGLGAPALALPPPPVPLPGPEPHLELAPQVGHLVQPVLLYTPAAAPLARVSAPLRFHLGGGPDTGGSGPGWLEKGAGADPAPRHPQPSPEWAQTAVPGKGGRNTRVLLLRPSLGVTASSYMKPSRLHWVRHPLWAHPAPWTAITAHSGRSQPRDRSASLHRTV